MLVLSRKENERIKLGSSIVVTVVRVGRDKVRLGIEAPADMLVLREELDALPAAATTPLAPAAVTEAMPGACTQPAALPPGGV